MVGQRCSQRRRRRRMAPPTPPPETDGGEAPTVKMGHEGVKGASSSPMKVINQAWRVEREEREGRRAERASIG